MVCFLLLALSFSSYGQRDVDDDATFSDRIYLGGGGGLNGGRDINGYRYFYIALNPIVGYMITQQWSAGVGVQWQLYQYPDLDISINQYGISPFTRYNFGNLFAYAEYSVINTPSLFNEERTNYNRLLGGLGYSLPLGRRGAINGMALYDFIYKNNGPFASPWVIRVFFSF